MVCQGMSSLLGPWPPSVCVCGGAGVLPWPVKLLGPWEAHSDHTSQSMIRARPSGDSSSQVRIQAWFPALKEPEPDP